MPHLLVLIGVALALGGQAEVWLADAWRGPRALDAAVAGAPLLLLALRRAPAAAGLALLGTYAVEALAFGTPRSITQFFAITTLVVWVAARGGRPRDVVLPAAFAALAVSLARDPDPLAPGDVVFPFVFLTGAAAVGGLLGRRARANAALLAEQDAVAERAAQGERLRIARELHDVVAHAVSVMVVQAVAARAQLARDPAATTQALDAIEATGQQALAELRGMLGVLREEEPGLEGLPALVQRARAGGLEVRLDLDAAGEALPGGIGLGAYRIVQEALTNVVRHAPGARADVVVRRRDGALEVEVRNTPSDGPPSPGTGRGLEGMRERAAALEGRLDAGPTEDGGFAVAARLPA